MTALALALFLEAAAADTAMVAYREGRWEEAVRLLESAPANGYDRLVALGVARGRLGRLDAAGEALDRAIVLAPGRPEAWVERGGLHFMARRYEQAASDLERALALREDTYARDLLASSLHLAGRPEEALSHWNALGGPTLRDVRITGLRHTKDHVARREITLREGDLLDADEVEKSHLRLEATGIFSSVTLRPVPSGDGWADLEVALRERHGFWSSLPEFVLTAGAHALKKKARLRYANLMGRGVTLTGEHKWESTQPHTELALDWVRPAGLPANLHVLAHRGRPSYDPEDPFQIRRRVLEVGVSRVAGPGSVGRLTFHASDRSFPARAPFDTSGRVLGLELGFDKELLDTRRDLSTSTVSVLRSLDARGSGLAFWKGSASVRYFRFADPRDDAEIPRRVLAAQVNLGAGGEEMPLDLFFLPGAASDADLPLRAHRRKSGGIAGRAPVGRTLALANLEVRQRVLRHRLADVGVVAFYDAGYVGQRAFGTGRVLHDIGVGVRLSIRGASVFRLDWAYSPTDGKNALTVGLGDVF